MIKYQRVLPLFVKLSKNAPAAKSLSITYLDYPSLYIFSEVYILLMGQVSDAIIKIDHNPARCYANFSYTNARSMIQELHVCPLKQYKENFPNFALFLDTNIKQTKIISHSIMSPFIITMHF